jgi:hypothetical protein
MQRSIHNAESWRGGGQRALRFRSILVAAVLQTSHHLSTICRVFRRTLKIETEGTPSIYLKEERRCLNN